MSLVADVWAYKQVIANDIRKFDGKKEPIMHLIIAYSTKAIAAHLDISSPAQCEGENRIL